MGRLQWSKARASGQLGVHPAEQQASLWRRVPSGQLGQLRREALEAKVNTEGARILQKKLARGRHVIRGVRARDVYPQNMKPART
jgi:hypothetical protein